MRKKERIVMNHGIYETMLCSYCGCTMVAMRSNDWLGWRYMHRMNRIATGVFSCPNEGKTYIAPLIKLEEV